MISRLKSSLAAVMFALCAFSGGNAFAADRSASIGVGIDGTRFQVVRYQDLDLESDAGNQTLYRRLRSAAVRVCGSADGAERLARIDQARCRYVAMSRAVRAIGRNSLTAVYLAQETPRAERG